MLIGLVGKARSGKDTVADHLVKNYNFRKIAFSDKLKKVCSELLDLTPEQCYGDLKEVVDQRYGKTPRWILQHIGADVFRAIRPDIWADIAIKRYRELAPKCSGVVISDIRFPNELEAVQRAEGIIWRICRPDHDGASGGIDAHSSEASMDDLLPDCMMEARSGEVQNLYLQADQEMRKILSRSER